MKRLVLICLFILYLTGCNANVIDNKEKNKENKPKTKTEEKVKKDEVIGSFETPVLDKDEERVNNLSVCSKALDGYIIAPGETFSFNDVVGTRTSEKGYEEARILVGCEKDYAVGGGVCQISSTLYNAAVNSGLEIIERHNHSRNVYYVPMGQDAAISYGTLDLKFKNSLQHNIKIAMSTDGNNVYASILKTEDEKGS